MRARERRQLFKRELLLAMADMDDESFKLFWAAAATRWDAERALARMRRAFERRVVVDDEGRARVRE